jgi:hypothetical protein
MYRYGVHCKWFGLKTVLGENVKLINLFLIHKIRDFLEVQPQAQQIKVASTVNKEGILSISGIGQP